MAPTDATCTREERGNLGSLHAGMVPTDATCTAGERVERGSPWRVLAGWM